MDSRPGAVSRSGRARVTVTVIHWIRTPAPRATMLFSVGLLLARAGSISSAISLTAPAAAGLLSRVSISGESRRNCTLSILTVLQQYVCAATPPIPSCEAEGTAPHLPHNAISELWRGPTAAAARGWLVVISRLDVGGDIVQDQGPTWRCRPPRSPQRMEGTLRRLSDHGKPRPLFPHTLFLKKEEVSK